ncbi:carbon monoxide dehydrogenase, partial [Patescibacteria group bacterium]|nr:carbon monoxide dehydrogenase [Patescibacteria group bacterium]
MEEKQKAVDKASQELLKKAKVDGVETAWERLERQIPQCGFGKMGICCRICSMGPCRITKKAEFGVCGATVDTIVARNFIRMIAGGAAAHSDHGRAAAEVFMATAEGKAPGYRIKDEKKLLQVAMDFGVEIGPRSIEEIAKDVGRIALAQFGNQKGELLFIKRAPLKRQEIWRKLGVVPRAIDREIVEIMHRTHMGVDMDYENLLLQGSRCALADGWGGSMIATELQDIMFGTPVPTLGKANLGVLKEDEVNIIVHGHEPLLSEMIVIAVSDKGLLKLAEEKGAKGINIAGICCTANELLMRHGIPIAGNMLQQELAILTGAVEAMVVDVQCIMQSLPVIAQCFHTEIITTSSRAKIPGATHIQFDEHNALASAKEIVRKGIEKFPKRQKEKVRIPKE